MNSGQTLPVAFGSGCESLETAEYIVRWKGFLFVRGCMAGEESAARIAAAWSRDDPKPALALAKGVFALCVFDKRTAVSWCAVDPFGLMRLFVSETAVNDDFFALIRQLGPSRGEIDSDALAAFFRLGFYNRGRTLDRRIRFLTGDEVAYCTPGQGVHRVERGLVTDGPDTVPFDFEAYIADLSIALRGHRISLDLTGGFDSRLIAASLVHAGAPVAEAVTTGQNGNSDVLIAKTIASRLRIPHVWIRHRISGFESRANRLLHLTQGQMGLLTYDHMYQIQQERVARGMTLGIGGAGGELWKDFLWLQDFPRLGGPPDFDRLYRRRFEPRPPSSSFLSRSFSDSFEAAAVNYLAEMKSRFGRLDRTHAYDAVYANLRLPFLMGPSIAAGINAGLPHFSPLLDREGINASMHRPRQERLFSRWHRLTIARMAPELIRVRTTEGLSARTGISTSADVPFYVADKVRRAAQKIAQQFNLPDVVRHSVEDPQTLTYGQRMTLSGDAIGRLIALGVVSAGVTADRLSRTALDRVLTAGLALLQIMP